MFEHLNISFELVLVNYFSLSTTYEMALNL